MKIHSMRWCVVVLGLACLAQACAGLRPGYEMPSVSVSSFRAVPADTGLPNFEIGLRVLNPNPAPLELRGVSFTVRLEGHNVIRGVGNKLPVIEAYGAGDFVVTASANILAGMRLVGDLMNGPRDKFQYELKAKLDVGAFRPAIRIRDSGEISLSPGGNER